MLHAGHWLRLAFLLLAQSHHLVVHFRRKHPQECHHPLHESAPARTKPVVLRLLHHLVHRHRRPFHERVLRKSGNRIGVFRHFRRTHLHSFVLHAGHVVHGLLRLRRAEWSIAQCLIASGTYAHATTQTRAFVLGSSVPLAQNAHTLFHAQARRHAVAPPGHRA